MSGHNYNDRIAKHYAAYRPPLHERILSFAIPKDSTFEVGLDIGAGTGYSTVALSYYCSRVVGVEPSDDMRSRAVPQNKVSYLPGAGEAIPLEDAAVDVVTLAGSLCYVDRDALVQELHRVCRNTATIIVYDFEVLLDPLWLALDVNMGSSSDGYDYAANLSGIDGLQELVVCSDKVLLSLSPSELSHVLLASAEGYSALAARWGEESLHHALTQLIARDERFASIDVDVYYSSYIMRENLERRG